jgi:hypothetical protein
MNVGLILAVLALVSGGSNPPDPLWVDDILIWDMDNSTTWLGNGYTYCNALYDPDGGLYAASVMDVTGGLGDLLRVYLSSDNGQSWSIGDFSTGGDWSLYDPEFTVSSGAPDYILLFYTALQTGDPGMSIVARYQLPGFSLLDGYVIDYTNPAADDLRSHTVARDPASGTVWHFSNDVSNQLFLSKSTDDGATWSPSELVASNVDRPTATPGPGGRIYVAYQETAGAEDVKCLVLTESGSTTSTVGSAAADAAPIPASEWSGSSIEVGIVYHDTGGNVILSISPDFGSSWDAPNIIGQGSYPFIDIYPGQRKPCMAYINAAGTGIMVSRAWGIPGLVGASQVLRTDQTPSTAGPPVIRYSLLATAAEIYGLFYMGAGPRDLWYDNSILTGLTNAEGEEADPQVLSLEPNPFTGSTSIRVTLTSPEFVTLDVFSLDGRLVEQLHSGVTGGNVFQAGELLPAGVYTVVLGTQAGTTTLRMVKL